MRYLGVDLAWVDADVVNETGVAALEPDGTISAAGWTAGVDQTAEWIQEHAGPDAVLFVDAPLIVLNADKQRLCEKQVGQRYGNKKVSANSTNTASPRLAGVRLREVLEEKGWRYDDGTAGPPSSGRRMSECYPYTTLVGTHELGYDEERPKYKRKPPRMATAQWRPLRAAACDDMLRRMARLASAATPMDLRSHPITATLLEEPSPEADRDYKHREDLIDACLAAWTAAMWQTEGLSRCQILGADDPLTNTAGNRATIIAPFRAA